MSKEQYPYLEDEFDVLGAQRAPKGVHREPEPAWTRWLPYLLVVLLVPLLTFGAVKFFSSGSEGEPEPSASDSGEEQELAPGAEAPEDGPEAGDTGDGESEDGGQAPEEPTEEPTEEPSEEPTEEPAELNYGTHVLVLNGAGVTGLAGQVTDLLGQQGWANNAPDNYMNTEPPTTTLYYTSAQFEEEAQAVAEVLGITNLRESASAASNGIVIVLRSDFTLP